MGSSKGKSTYATGAVVPARSWVAVSLWWMMLLTCVAIGIYATQYFVLPVRDEHFERYIVPLRLHIAGGAGALLRANGLSR